MTSQAKDDIERLKTYLQTPNPGYALLIGGKWGTGKSHLWRTFTTNDFPRLGLKDFTMSVAGLETLEELERALFAASIKRAPRVLVETTTVIGRAILRHYQVDPKDIVLKADVRQGKTVVCIDDVERFAGPWNVLFGFILGLVDDNRLHVVLIADEDHIAPDLKKVQERVVGRYMLAPNQVESFFDQTYKGISDIWTRGAFERCRDRAIEFLNEKGVVNLRSVRNIIAELDEIMRAMPRSGDQEPDVWRLFTAVSFHVLAKTKNASNVALVQRAIATPNMSTLLMFSRVEDENEGSNSKSGKEDQELKDLSSLVDDIGFQHDMSLWRGSPAFSTYIGGGPLDSTAIANDFRLFEKEKKPSKDELMIYRLRDYRTDYAFDEQAIFDSNVQHILGAIKGRSLKATHQLWIAYEALYHLCSVHLVDISPSDFTAIFIDAVDGYDPAKIDDTRYMPVQQADQLQQDAHDAVDRLAEKCQMIRHRKTIEETITRIIEVSNEMVDGQYLVLFMDADAKIIFDRLRAAGAAGVYRMTRFFARRGERVPWQELEVELPFAKAMVALIEDSFPDAKEAATRSLESAAFHALEGMLRTTILDRFKAKPKPKLGGAIS